MREGCAAAQAPGKLATIAVSRLALTPNKLRGRGVQYSPRTRNMAREPTEEPEDEVDAENEAEDSEADAEGEVEDDSEADAEGEDDDDEEVVGAVKTRSLRRNSRRNAQEDEDDSDAEVGEDDDSDSDSSGSGAENDWEAADEDAADEVELPTAAGSQCT